ncbi:MAG: 4Fe-4S binding protein [Clostridiales Family XIII bacterium]|nr:4Fe-4S binding protein [Clostridiales Family XIII bacterium]
MRQTRNAGKRFQHERSFAMHNTNTMVKSMDAKGCLEKLKYVGVAAFATVDQAGNPQVRNISAIHYEQDALYFLTARGKNFCKELQKNRKVQILGYTKYKEMIRLSAQAEVAPGAEQKKWTDIIFTEQPYLANVYPGNTREICILFCIQDAEIEYFHMGVNPIFRGSYTIGNAGVSQKGYRISEICTGCGVCADVCPQRCLERGQPYLIKQEHCLHCGNCFEHCPIKAICPR